MKNKFQLQTPIITILANQISSTLAIQSVDNDKSKLEFLDFNNGELVNKTLTFNSFEIVKAFVGNILVLQEYDKDNFPAVKQLYTFDIVNQEVLNVYKNASFLALEGSKMLVLNNINEQISEQCFDIDVNIDELNNDTFKTNIFFPQNYRNDNLYYPEIVSFLSQYEAATIFDTVEYLEWNDLILISYYICNEEQLFNNYLLVINSQGELVLSETLSENSKGTAEISFFIAHKHLVYLGNHQEITTMKLEF